MNAHLEQHYPGKVKPVRSRTGEMSDTDLVLLGDSEIIHRKSNTIADDHRFTAALQVGHTHSECYTGLSVVLLQLQDTFTCQHANVYKRPLLTTAPRDTRDG